MGLTFAGNIIDALRKSLGLDDETYVIIQIWEKELSPLMNNAALVGVKKGTLIVEVASSVHFQELAMRKREVINKINQYFSNKKVVKELKIQIKK